MLPMLLVLVHTDLWAPLGVQAVLQNRANGETEPEEVVEVAMVEMETKGQDDSLGRRRPAPAQGLPRSHVENGARLQLVSLPQRQRRFPGLWPVVLLLVLFHRAYLYRASRRSLATLPLLPQEQAATGPSSISIRER